MTSWTDPAWLRRVHAWIRSELDRQGVSVVGTIEQPHVRPWSTVLRVPTPEGSVWFKANMPALAQEAAVVQVLSRCAADRVPTLLAVDLEHGWMLQADGGRRLREELAASFDPGRWEEVLARYAELQITASAETGALLAAGAPDRRLARLPALYEGLVADDPALKAGHGPGLSTDEIARLRALTPYVESLCGGLASLGLPETIQHDDLHDGQVFVSDGRDVFFDWGDASVSHPFLSLTIPLRVIASQLGVEEAAPELGRSRDAYLRPWASFADAEALRVAAPAARWLGGVSRALTWRTVTSNLPAAAVAEYAESVPGWLRLLLASAPEVMPEAVSRKGISPF